MNPKLYEFLETLGMRILKIESGTLWMFGNFKKLNLELCKFLKTLGTRI